MAKTTLIYKITTPLKMKWFVFEVVFEHEMGRI